MKIIRNAGFRATKPRVLVFSFLQKAKHPLDIKEIVAGVGRKNIDQVTVYRILDAFKNAGIVTQIDFQHGHAHYELKDAKHGHHHHIVCTKCDEIEDFENQELEKIIGRVVGKSSKFKNIKEHSLELFGLCRVCA